MGYIFTIEYNEAFSVCYDQEGSQHVDDESTYHVFASRFGEPDMVLKEDFIRQSDAEKCVKELIEHRINPATKPDLWKGLR